MLEILFLFLQWQTIIYILNLTWFVVHQKVSKKQEAGFCVLICTLFLLLLWIVNELNLTLVILYIQKWKQLGWSYQCDIWTCLSFDTLKPFLIVFNVPLQWTLNNLWFACESIELENGVYTSCIQMPTFLRLYSMIFRQLKITRLLLFIQALCYLLIFILKHN